MEESMKKAAEVLNKHSLGGRPLKVKEVRRGAVVKGLRMKQRIMDRKQDLNRITHPPSQPFSNNFSHC